MIDLHFWPTPNSLKVSILFEEIKLLKPDFEYQIVPCSIGTGDQFKPEFIAISPNNRMPAMVDHQPDGILIEQFLILRFAIFYYFQFLFHLV